MFTQKQTNKNNLKTEWKNEGIKEKFLIDTIIYKERNGKFK